EAHRPLVRRTAVAVDDGGNLSKVRRVEISAGTIEVRCVQRIENVDSEFPPYLLRESEQLRDGRVEVDVLRAVEHGVALCGAPRVGRRVREHRCIEPEI